MDIGLLNTSIFITKNEVTVDAIGNHKNVWIPYYHCHATVSSEAGKENTDAGLVIDSSKIDFTIRWCQKATVMCLSSPKCIKRARKSAEPISTDNV